MTAGFFVELADHVLEVVGDLADRLLGEDLRVRVRFRDRLGVVRPTGRDGGVPGCFEDAPPTVPAAREQPEPVHEHDRRLPRVVGGLDLVGFVLGEVGHGNSLYGG